jgi:hypothetical protein
MINFFKKKEEPKSWVTISETKWPTASPIPEPVVQPVQITPEVKENTPQPIQTTPQHLQDNAFNEEKQQINPNKSIPIHNKVNLECSDNVLQSEQGNKKNYPTLTMRLTPEQFTHIKTKTKPSTYVKQLIQKDMDNQTIERSVEPIESNYEL